MKEFAIAYETISSLSPKEAKEKLSLLRRYLVPLEKEVPKDFFRELFVTTFGISERDLSLVEDQGTLLVHLYNLTLRRAKGEELLKDEEKEYAFYSQYKDLLKHFPDVNVDGYDEEVVKFFSLRHGEMVEELAQKLGIKEKVNLCSSRPRLVKENSPYFTLQCYSSKKKKGYSITRGKEETIIPLYAVAVAYFYLKEESGGS